MIYGLYSVKDRLIGYNAPFIMVSDDVAKREFINSVKKNPSKNDLSLVKIGEFDDKDGNIQSWTPANEILLEGKEIANEI